jgi:hypothetical protein
MSASALPGPAQDPLAQLAEDGFCVVEGVGPSTSSGAKR